MSKYSSHLDILFVRMVGICLKREIMCEKKFLSIVSFHVFVLQTTYSHLQYVVIGMYITTLLTDFSIYTIHWKRSCNWQSSINGCAKNNVTRWGLPIFIPRLSLLTTEWNEQCGSVNCKKTNRASSECSFWISTRLSVICRSDVLQNHALL